MGWEKTTKQSAQLNAAYRLYLPFGSHSMAICFFVCQAELEIDYWN